MQATHRGVAAGGEWTGTFTRSSEAYRRATRRYAHGTKVFTCSMSDFWHDRVPLDWLAEALDGIDQTPHFHYQVLTKRPGAFFHKQWGNWQSNPTPPDQELDPGAKCGATLDGRLWRDFPDLTESAA